MHGQDPFTEFETGRGSSRRAGWIAGFLAFSTLLVVLAGAGYGFGRGTWTLPPSVTARVPEALARWLPPHVVGGSAGMPDELKDYSFELVDGKAKQGPAVLAVRLVRKPSGKPVPGAVVFAKRLDMAPEAMPTMTAELEPRPEEEPGVYRFQTNLTMKGAWQLSLAAKVPGKIGTVQNKLVLKAMP